MPLSPVLKSTALGCAAAFLFSVNLHGASSPAGSAPRGTAAFLEKHCAGCHDEVEKKGDLDLTTLKFEPGDAKNFAKWVTIFDRVADGEMPPKKKKRPEPAELAEAAGRSQALGFRDRKRGQTLCFALVGE